MWLCIMDWAVGDFAVLVVFYIEENGRNELETEYERKKQKNWNVENADGAVFLLVLTVIPSQTARAASEQSTLKFCYSELFQIRAPERLRDRRARG